MSLFSQNQSSSKKSTSDQADNNFEPSTRQSLPVEKKDAPRDKRHRSVLQSDLVITGDVTTTGFLELSGHVTGDVSADTLTLHEGSTLKGNATGKHISTDGTITGSIKADDVALQKRSKTQADISCDRFAVETGAVIHGKLDVSSKFLP
jgi:cytoskeletal protein CcmA (bactofilin family)